MAGDRPPMISPLAVTMGEPAGIGPEVTIAAWLDRRERGLPAFYCLADPSHLADRARQIGVECPIETVTPEDAAACFDRALPAVPLAAKVRGRAGDPDPTDAGAVIEAITRAVADVRAGTAAAVVTNPVHKKTLHAAGFAHPGHTEFLATLSPSPDGAFGYPVMMLVGPDLRTVPVTIHIALREVAAALTEQRIVETGRVVATDLRRRFAVAKPRLAVAGLNPHAGEGGAFGDEDDRVVRPAVAALNRDGIDAVGPLPADSMFHAAARARYDAAICMYHDQALIPVKTLAFAETVNVTLGLAVIRTSPDHGTALDIAGRGIADPSSLAAAIRLAAQLKRNEMAA